MLPATWEKKRWKGILQSIASHDDEDNEPNQENNHSNFIFKIRIGRLP